MRRVILTVLSDTVSYGTPGSVWALWHKDSKYEIRSIGYSIKQELTNKEKDDSHFYTYSSTNIH